MICALLLPEHVVVAWKLLQKACTFGNQGLSSHSEERNKKSKFFGILSQLKKMSKFNDVPAQNVCKQYVTSYYCR
jgi:hypothetical protein